MKRFLPFVFLMIVTIAWSSNPGKVESGSGEQQLNAEYNTAKNEPFLIKGEITTKKNDEEAHSDAENEKVKAASDAAITCYTFWLAVFTFLLFCFTAALWFVTYRLANDARETSKRQAEEMRRSIEIAKGSADLARQEFIATKRAYVFVDHIDGRIVTVGEPYFRVQITWRNSGATPTKNMMNHVNIDFFENDIPDDFTFPDYGDGNIPLFIGPNGVTLSDPLIIKKEFLDKINSGIVSAYIYGWAEYFDVVDSLKIHRTEFCYKLLMEASEITDTGKTRAAAISFHLHRNHNGMDEECERQPFTKLPQEI